MEMELLRIFNNNVVLARRADGGEVILTGRGLGYQAKAGDAVDMTKVVRTFVPADGRDPDHMAQLLAEITPEMIQLVVRSARQVGIDEAALANPTLVIALADHLTLAINRTHSGQILEYPLTGEVLHLYPDEYARAGLLLDAVNAELDVALPQTEATALALHLVNAGFATGDLSWTYTMTGVIQQIIEVVEGAFDLAVDVSSISAARFITHLRYLFVRVKRDKQLVDQAPPIVEAIRTSYPKGHECAQTIARLMELRLGEPLSEDEISYLTLHVVRLTTP